ncbi:MAG: glycosyltransferase [Chloroflexi bacterium]|nr:MAG: glycosyltransferase [Chloroflexota bacterium]MBL1193888.1 glycosyltransferase [Chloroflexota bacterium]NOH11182.1 glycosyltransferase family 2 protein [Chloroflexota bacterium]
MSASPVFSVIVPIYNESGSIPELHRRICEVMDAVDETWEFILVDDGSRDNSRDLIQELAAEDERVRPVIFARNFGQQNAVVAGLDYSRGKAVIVIDADLQDPPELIHELIAKWREGYEVVYAQRTERAGESFMKLITAKLFYRVIDRITDIDLPLDTGFFRLLDRTVVDVMVDMREHHRFFRGLSIWVGFRQIAVPYKRAARFAGETHYTLRNMVRLAATAITGFSFFPLQVATFLGFFSAGISLLAIPTVIILRLAGVQAFLGQATTLIAVLFFGGVQLISLGILGEYIGRLYDEARGRPLYIVREAPDMNHGDTD